MDYTQSRLLQIPDILPSDMSEKINVLMTLTLTYCFDGTSSHNSYNRDKGNSTKSDRSITKYSMVALALEMKDKETSTSTIVCQNQFSGLTRLCTVMKFCYAKEIKETIISEVAQIQHQVIKLKEKSTQLGEGCNRCKVTH